MANLSHPWSENIYLLIAHPDMAVFPDVTSMACTMALNGGMVDRSAEFYEAVVSNFAVVMGCLMQAGIIRPLAAPAPTPEGEQL